MKNTTEYTLSWEDHQKMKAIKVPKEFKEIMDNIRSSLNNIDEVVLINLSILYYDNISDCLDKIDNILNKINIREDPRTKLFGQLNKNRRFDNVPGIIIRNIEGRREFGRGEFIYLIYKSDDNNITIERNDCELSTEPVLKNNEVLLKEILSLDRLWEDKYTKYTNSHYFLLDTDNIDTLLSKVGFFNSMKELTESGVLVATLKKVREFKKANIDIDMIVQSIILDLLSPEDRMYMNNTTYRHYY